MLTSTYKKQVTFPQCSSLSAAYVVLQYLLQPATSGHINMQNDTNDKCLFSKHWQVQEGFLSSMCTCVCFLSLFVKMSSFTLLIHLFISVSQNSFICQTYECRPPLYFIVRSISHILFLFLIACPFTSGFVTWICYRCCCHRLELQQKLTLHVRTVIRQRHIQHFTPKSLQLNWVHSVRSE